MESHGYPGAEGHKPEHVAFIEQVTGFLGEFAAGKRTLDELLDILRAWLSGHILKVDMAYSDYLVQKGAK